MGSTTLKSQDSTDYWVFLIVGEMRDVSAGCSLCVITLQCESETALTIIMSLVANKSSLNRLDDPLIWGILPLRYFFDAVNMRWGLGAHDICFKNK
jgi:hypothetical protein